MPITARRALLVFALVSLAGLSMASVSQASGSRAGVFLPDIRCEGREARPEGAFNPVGMPFLFEDPHITTGLNFAYVYHRFPRSGALGVAFDGGGAHVLALQIRAALTDRLGLIATRDSAPRLHAAIVPFNFWTTIASFESFRIAARLRARLRSASSPLISRATDVMKNSFPVSSPSSAT